jgi:hypothetical protein
MPAGLLRNPGIPRPRFGLPEKRSFVTMSRVVERAAGLLTDAG